MGQTNSLDARVAGELSLNRIRDACQADSPVSKEISQYKVRLLANDMNAMGMHIPVRDSRGRPLSEDDICTEISRRAIPNVENVCMIHRGRGKKDVQALVEKMARHFNDNYGARISIYKNPLDHSSGKRKVSDICDDLYMVSDKLLRNLTDEPKIIKSKLEKALSNLAQQKALLESQFNRSLSNLAQAKSKDKYKDQIKAAQVMQDIVVGNLNQQLQNATAQYATLKEQLEGPYAQNLKSIDMDLSQYGLFGAPGMGMGTGNMPFAEPTYKLGPLLSAMQKFPVAINTCTKCLRQYNLSLDDYQRLSAKENFPHELQKLYLQLRQRAHDKNDRAALDNLNKCYTNLLYSGPEQCTMDSRVNTKEAVKLARGMTRDTLRYANLNNAQGIAEVLKQQLSGIAPVATASPASGAPTAAKVAGLTAPQAAKV